MMDTQNIIAGLIILIAVIYATRVFVRKSKAFSPKAGCVDDCGCSSKSKTTNAAH